MISYIFLGTSNHPKATITLKRLTQDGYFRPSNCIVITNSIDGSFPKLSSDLGYQVKVVNSDYDTLQVLKNIDFDFLICCGWHLKISKKVLKLPKIAAINSHSSYLPDYKGLGAYKHAWANVEKYAGNTIHLMDENFDTGIILAQKKVRIYFWDTPKTLLKRISRETPNLIQLGINRCQQKGTKCSQRNNKNGRYFFKTSKSQFIRHRLYNLIAKTLGLELKLTKYKVK